MSKSQNNLNYDSSMNDKRPQKQNSSLVLVYRQPFVFISQHETRFIENKVVLIPLSQMEESREKVPANFQSSLNYLIKEQPLCLVSMEDEVMRSVMTQIISQFGFKVIETCNGFEALEIVRKSVNSVSQLFDLCILDLCMSITNGFEACQFIRNLFN